MPASSIKVPTYTPGAPDITAEKMRAAFFLKTDIAGLTIDSLMGFVGLRRGDERV